jgi:hypothetical protein
MGEVERRGVAARSMLQGPALWLALALVSSACVQILGDGYEIVEDEGQGGSASSSSGAGGSAMQGGGSQGGSGGQGPCTPGDVGACGAGMKCSVLNVSTGEVGCVAAGPRSAFARCDADTNCVDGTWCDIPGKVCLPICQALSDCANGGQCIGPADANMMPVMGVKVCLANCNLISGAPCDQSFGPVTCLPPQPGSASSCWQSNGVAVGQSCTDPADCEVGAICAGTPPSCLLWCTPLGQAPQCSAAQQCADVGVTANGMDYGVCN